MKKMLILAMTMAMVLLAAAGVCETLRVGMECNYAPYNWTQSDAGENAVAIAAGGYADGETLAALTAAGLDVPRVLADNDAYHALQAVGGLIMTGPTGTNVNDVAVVLTE